MAKKTTKTCVYCQKRYLGGGRSKYCSATCKGKAWHEANYIPKAKHTKEEQRQAMFSAVKEIYAQTDDNRVAKALKPLIIKFLQRKC